MTIIETGGAGTLRTTEVGPNGERIQVIKSRAEQAHDPTVGALRRLGSGVLVVNGIRPPETAQDDND